MDVPTIPARSIVIKNKSTAWFGTRYTMNIYRGCSHGCIYCDSRSECYGVQDFDTVRVKSDALAVIRNDLRSKTQSGVVTTGSMSDPYNPFEKELQLTRHALELDWMLTASARAVASKRDAHHPGRGYPAGDRVSFAGAVQDNGDDLRRCAGREAGAARAFVLGAAGGCGEAGGAGHFYRRSADARPTFPGGYAGRGAQAGAGGVQRRGALCISGLRCDAAPEPAGLFSGQAGRAVPRAQGCGARYGAAVRHTV